ncbi:MAG: glycosyltransferase family 2 protein [Treponema sp.]|nr:glycosyltransferase family 2 protein [Treponema sp.]
MTLPFISVLIPVYGVEKYVEHCVRSLFENSIADKCEFVVVNDCTADNSMDIIKSVVCEYPSICVRFIEHETNRGLAAARNTALLQAHGKYIICVDSDDWVEPDYLEKLYNEAENSGADIVGCNYFREYSSGTELCRNPIEENSRQALKDIVSGKSLAFLWIKLFKRELFAENGIAWTEGLDVTEDVIVCSRLFAKAKAISYIKEPLYHYNLQNQGSLTARLNEKKINQIIEACNLIEKELLHEADCKNAVKQRKAFSKIWILKCADELKKEYFSLWNDEKLYKLSNISLKRKIILFLCNMGLCWTVKKLIKFSK